MIDENQLVKIKWGMRYKTYYINNGFEFTKIGDEFLVPLNQTHDGYAGDVVVHCDYCGEERIIRKSRYNEAISKYGKYYCSHCSKQHTIEERRKSHYERCLQFCEKHGYIPVTQESEIETVESKFEYICPEHGLQTVKVKTLLANKQCYPCSRQVALKKKWSHGADERREELYGKILDACNEKGYKLLTTINEIDSGWDTYVRYECHKHGKHKMSVNNLVGNHRGCPDCAIEAKRLLLPLVKNEEDIKGKNGFLLHPDLVEKRVADCDGVLLNKNEYINNTTKNLKILCPRCGQPFITSLQNFVQHGGQVCQDCYRKESIGEMKIRQYLERNNINFDPEHWFPDCRDINPLPFDFYLEERNTIIEFDGKQHFEDTHFFNNTSLRKTQKHDSIKNKYCEEHGIYLIRIPYWDLNRIDEILDEKFNNIHMKI